MKKICSTILILGIILLQLTAFSVLVHADDRINIPKPFGGVNVVFGQITVDNRSASNYILKVDKIVNGLVEGEKDFSGKVALQKFTFTNTSISPVNGDIVAIVGLRLDGQSGMYFSPENLYFMASVDKTNFISVFATQEMSDYNKFCVALIQNYVNVGEQINYEYDTAKQQGFIMQNGEQIAVDTQGLLILNTNSVAADIRSDIKPVVPSTFSKINIPQEMTIVFSVLTLLVCLCALFYFTWRS